ncbi:MAG: zinc-dependent metalloproteinase lipoprotein [Rikenellaceae bacterium]
MYKLKTYIIAIFTLAVVCSCGSNPEISDSDTDTTQQEDSGSSSDQTTSDDSTADLSDYPYEIPIIFHVLYVDSDDTYQNPEIGRIAEIMEYTNYYFNGTFDSADINVQFILAENDPDGNPLSEAGVDRVYIEGTYPIDPEELMTTEDYKHILWDSNSYINVMMYVFEDEENKGIMGVAHMPIMYKYSDNLLDRVITTNYQYLTLDNIGFTYCVSINSTYIYNQSTDTTIDTYDVTATLAHELAHHLGLHHVFAEDETTGEMLDTYDDKDYCDDTPTYNRIEYSTYISDYYVINRPPYDFLDLILRWDEEGTTYYSTNIMDYSYTLTDQFTENQKDRMRTVLQYGLLNPGSQADSKTKAAAPSGIVDIPYKLTSCTPESKLHSQMDIE